MHFINLITSSNIFVHFYVLKREEVIIIRPDLRQDYISTGFVNAVFVCGIQYLSLSMPKFVIQIFIQAILSSYVHV